jgi:hypothetical protein
MEVGVTGMSGDPDDSPLPMNRSAGVPPAYGIRTRKAGEDAGAPPGSGAQIVSPRGSWNLSRWERETARRSQIRARHGGMERSSGAVLASRPCGFVSNCTCDRTGFNKTP